MRSKVRDLAKWMNAGIFDGKRVHRSGCEDCHAEASAYLAVPWFERCNIFVCEPMSVAVGKYEVTGSRSLGQVTDKTGIEFNDGELARDLHRAGFVLWLSGRYDEARPLFERAETVARMGDSSGRIDYEGIAERLHEVGMGHLRAGAMTRRPRPARAGGSSRARPPPAPTSEGAPLLALTMADLDVDGRDDVVNVGPLHQSIGVKCAHAEARSRRGGFVSCWAPIVSVLSRATVGRSGDCQPDPLC